MEEAVLFEEIKQIELQRQFVVISQEKTPLNAVCLL